jgi:hypothetical protein
MEAVLPSPRPCSMCRSESRDRVKVLIRPRLGRIELSSGEIDAAVFACTLCGAVRKEPLQRSVQAA